MADLSDTDKKILLGENYLEIEKQAALRRNLSQGQEEAEELQKKMLNYRTTAGIIFLLAAVVFITNYLQLSGPYQPYMSIAAAGGTIIGAICAVWAHTKLRFA